MKPISYYFEKSVEKATNPLPFGLREALRTLVKEIEFSIFHFQGLIKARNYKSKQGLCVQIGSGRQYKEGWVNIDLSHKADLKLDLRRPLPLPDNSAVIIYGEHFFEHIDFPEPALNVLKDYYRVLEPGGLLSLVVPDMELVLKAYVLGGSKDYYEAQDKWHPYWCHTKMDHINHNFRQLGEHRYAYDFETLEFYLKQTRFVNIQRRKFNPILDRKERITGSLYVDCNKPE